MTKENKIVRYNLEDEAQQLRDLGNSYQSVADALAENHPKITDIQKLSPMAVMRYFDSLAERKLQGDLDVGKDPVKDLTDEFCTAVRDINQRSESIYNRSIRLLDDLEAGDADSVVVLKAIKEARDSLAEERKNMVALKQYGEKKSITIQNVNLKKEIHVKNMLLDFSKDLNKELCPACRMKMPIILEKIDDI